MSNPVMITRTLPSGEIRDVLRVEGIEFRRAGASGAKFCIYVRDSGAGKDQLVIEADDGTVLVIATDD